MGISQTEAGEFSSPIEGIVHRGLWRGRCILMAERGSMWLGHGILGDRVKKRLRGKAGVMVRNLNYNYWALGSLKRGE